MARPDFTRHLVIAVIPLIATSHEKGEVAMAGMRVMGRQSWKRNDNCERRSAHFIAKKEARRWLSPAPFPGLSRQGSGGRGSASGAAALIEVEVRDGLVFGQVVGRRRRSAPASNRSVPVPAIPTPFID
jgi:hypothetical protein